MKPANQHRRLLTLLGELCNGTLSESSGAELEELLANDPRARAEYANYMMLHASLHGEAASLVSMDQRRSESVADSPAISPARSRWPGYALAAALVGVALFAAWNFGLVTGPSEQNRTASGVDGADPNEAPTDSPNGSPSYVARITGTHNCRWSQHSGSESIGYGSHLSAGQRLELREGLAEITFNDGASLLLEGPAEMVVASPGELALDSGRVAGVVPTRARGFRIRTAAIDL